MGKATSQANLLKTDGPSLTSRRRHGRAVNAVADFLRSRLRVPNVYIDPSISGHRRIDVLAVDAAGSGDVHAVEVEYPMWTEEPAGNVQDYFERLKQLPTHYKYLAFSKNGLALSRLSASATFASDGIGRIGVLFLSETDGAAPVVELAVSPERFKVSSDKLARVERFLEKTKPDMYVRL